ncbi:MAG: hypothetical protein EAX96_15060 [Candidatus Lokiarchaeota archaeon]|nr:hypothetical protein [Candidatus Lokiarchaeota archaeon]
MPVKRNRWYHRLIGKIGRKLYYAGSAKLNLMAVTLIVRNTMDEYKDILGSYEKGIKAFEDACKLGTMDVISDMMQQKIFFGVGLYNITSRYVPDSAWAIELGLGALAGNDFIKNVFSSANFLPAEVIAEEHPKIVVKFKKCMMCAGVPNSKKNELGNACYGGYFGVLLAAALQMMGEEVGWNYNFEGTEVKCFLDGDDHGEFHLQLTPAEE